MPGDSCLDQFRPSVSRQRRATHLWHIVFDQEVFQAQCGDVRKRGSVVVQYERPADRIFDSAVCARARSHRLSCAVEEIRDNALGACAGMQFSEACHTAGAHILGRTRWSCWASRKRPVHGTQQASASLRGGGASVPAGTVSEASVASGLQGGAEQQVCNPPRLPFCC